jgi:hypothetical protein
LDECLDRYEKAGFTLSPNKMRHPAGHYNGFVKLSGSYLEFISIVDEEEFNREATDDDRYFRNNPKPFAIGATSDNVDNIYEKLVSQYPDLPKTYSRGEAGLNDGPLLWSFLTLPTSVLSGANVFCLKYLKSPSLMYDLKVSNNGTYAVGGFVFCTNDPISRCREWESILTIVADKVSRIDEREIFSAERTLKWISSPKYEDLFKRPWQKSERPCGEIAAVKLLTNDIVLTKISLEKAGFQILRDSNPLLVDDPGSGFTYWIQEMSTEDFCNLSSLVKK